MKNKQTVQPVKAIVFKRADPDALSAFDPDTKRCVMNCGPHAQDPRTSKERKLLCDDCELVAKNLNEDMGGGRQMMFEEKRMPTPDEYGFFCHPDVPGEEESDDVRALCNALGFDAAAVNMESDAPELSDAWHENEDMTAPTRWTPTPPDGDGWMLVAKYDTEDGPEAMFIRPNTLNFKRVPLT